MEGDGGLRGGGVRGVSFEEFSASSKTMNRLSPAMNMIESGGAAAREGQSSLATPSSLDVLIREDATPPLMRPGGGGAPQKSPTSPATATKPGGRRYVAVDRTHELRASAAAGRSRPSAGPPSQPLLLPLTS